MQNNDAFELILPSFAINFKSDPKEEEIQFNLTIFLDIYNTP